MTKQSFYFLILTFITVFSFTSCEKNSENEEELITTLTYKLTPSTSGNAVTFIFKDTDGPGGNAPMISVSPLKANTVYNGELTFTNESVSPSEDITSEVKTEGKEHQVFFQSSLVKVEYTDKDSDGNPLGLTSKLTTTGAGAGKLKIILRHEPNKTASGVKDGNITNAGGETDIEVEFDITVQ